MQRVGEVELCFMRRQPQPVADLLLGWARGVAQLRRRGHDPPIEAITALRHLLGDERHLQRMRLLRRA